MYITDKFIFSDDFFMYKQIFIFFLVSNIPANVNRNRLV